MLEDRTDRAPDVERLMGIAEQVSDDSDSVGMGQFDERHDVRTLGGEGRMHRVPDAFMAEEDTNSFRLLVAEVEGMAAVTHELGSPLPALAAVASLQYQPLLAEAVPERSIESVRRWFGLGQTGVEVRGVRHSVDSLPKMQELTGLTMGPEQTMATSAPGT